MQATKEAPVTIEHEARIRALLEDADITVVEVYRVPANPRMYRARVAPLTDMQARKALPQLRRAAAVNGYGIDPQPYAHDTTDVIRVEVLA